MLAKTPHANLWDQTGPGNISEDHSFYESNMHLKTLFYCIIKICNEIKARTKRNNNISIDLLMIRCIKFFHKKK